VDNPNPDQPRRFGRGSTAIVRTKMPDPYAAARGGVRKKSGTAARMRTAPFR
jgi:hypothetical protein